jgi:peptidoglycan/xylan/chitin deacetylase (PgdA/CDA1 family)
VRADYLPYEARRNPHWPNGAFMAVAVNVALEEWDPVAAALVGHGPPFAPPIPRGARALDLSAVSMIEYGFRIGIHRLRELWLEFELVPSIFANGLAVERHPQLMSTLMSEGASLIGHGVDQSVNMAELDRDGQLAVIREARDIVRRELGADVRGWSSPATRETEELLRLLAEEGFQFHVGLHSDELPYWLEFGDGLRLLELGQPNALIGRGRTEASWRAEAEGLIAVFEARLGFAETKPSLTPLSFNPAVDGRPERVLAYRELVTWLREQPGVWLTNFDDIAKWMATTIE